MIFGHRWREWWDRLSGGTGEDAGSTSESVGPGPGSAQAKGAGALGKDATGPAGDLRLKVETGRSAPEAPRRKRVSRVGFDPYSNDAGYDKPRTWDDVDTR